MARMFAGDISPNHRIAATRTELVESRVRELESQGCELVVARGAQAQIVKRSNLRMPLVEIRVTTQELAPADHIPRG